MTLRKRQNLRLQSKLSYCLVRKISSKGLNAKNCRFPSSWYLQHRQRERVHYNWSKSWRWQPHPCVRIGSAEIFYHNDCFLSKRNYGSPFVYGISWNQAKALERPLVERQLFCREYWLCKQRKHYSFRCCMSLRKTFSPSSLRKKLLLGWITPLTTSMLTATATWPTIQDSTVRVKQNSQGHNAGCPVCSLVLITTTNSFIEFEFFRNIPPTSARTSVIR